MADLGDLLNDLSLRKQVLDGIVSHGYDKHVRQQKEFGGPSKTSPERYRMIGNRTLNQANKAYAFRQSGANHYLLGDKKQVVWIARDRSKSTAFQPENVDRYMSRQAKLKKGVPVDLKQIRAMAPRPAAPRPASLTKTVLRPVAPQQTRTASPTPKPVATPPRAQPKPVVLKPAAPRPTPPKPAAPRVPPPGRTPEAPGPPRR